MMWISVHGANGVCFAAPSWNQPPELQELDQVCNKPMEIQKLLYNSNCAALLVNDVPLPFHELTFSLSEHQEQQQQEQEQKEHQEYRSFNEMCEKSINWTGISKKTQIGATQNANQQIFLLRAKLQNKLGDVVIVIGVPELYSDGLYTCKLFSRLVLQVLEDASEHYKTMQVFLNALCTNKYVNERQTFSYHNNTLTYCKNVNSLNYSTCSTANMRKSVDNDLDNYGNENFFHRLRRENSTTKPTKERAPILNSSSIHDKAKLTDLILTVTTNEDKLRRSAFLYFVEKASLSVSVLVCSVTLEEHFHKHKSSLFSSLSCTTLPSSQINMEPLPSSSKLVNGTLQQAQTTSLSLCCKSLLRANEKLCKRSEFWRKLVHKAEFYVEEIAKVVYTTMHGASVHYNCTNPLTLHDVWGRNDVFSFTNVNPKISDLQARDNREQDKLNVNHANKSNKQEENSVSSINNNISCSMSSSNIFFCAVFTPRGLLVASESFMNSTLCHMDKVMLAALAVDRLTSFHSKPDFLTTFCKGVVNVDVLKLNLSKDINFINSNNNTSVKKSEKVRLPIELVVWTIGDALCVLVAFKVHDKNEFDAINSTLPNETLLMNKYLKESNRVNNNNTKSNASKSVTLSSTLTAETLMEFIISQCSQSRRCMMHSATKENTSSEHTILYSYEECLEYLCSHSTHQEEKSTWEGALRIFDIEQRKEQELITKTHPGSKNYKKKKNEESNTINNTVGITNISNIDHADMEDKEKSKNDTKELNDLSSTQKTMQQLEFYELWCNAAACASVLEYHAVSHYLQHNIESLLWEIKVEYDSNINKKNKLSKSKPSSASKISTGNNVKANEEEMSEFHEEECFTVGLFALSPSLTTSRNVTNEANNELLNKPSYIFNPSSVIHMTSNLFERSEATTSSMLCSTTVLPLPIIYNMVQCQCVAGNDEMSNKLLEQCNNSQHNVEVSVLSRHYVLNTKSQGHRSKSTHRESKHRKEINVNSVDANKSKSNIVEESTQRNSTPTISTSSITTSNNNNERTVNVKEPETTLGTSASALSNTSTTENVSLPSRSKSADTRASSTSFFAKLSKRLSRSLSRSRSKRIDARVSSTSTPPLPLYPVSISALDSATSVSAHTNDVHAGGGGRDGGGVSNEYNSSYNNILDINHHSGKRTMHINEAININQNVLNVEATLMRALRKRNVSFLTENNSKELRSLCKEIIFAQEATETICSALINNS